MLNDHGRRLQRRSGTVGSVAELPHRGESRLEIQQVVGAQLLALQLNRTTPTLFGMAEPTAAEDSPWLEAVPLRQTLRYGENPHQKARWFSHPKHGWGGAIQLQGKELSTNNLLDLEAALATVREFGYGADGSAPALQPAAVIVKHTNPCGVAIGASIPAALTRACLLYTSPSPRD